MKKKINNLKNYLYICFVFILKNKILTQGIGGTNNKNRSHNIKKSYSVLP